MLAKITVCGMVLLCLIWTDGSSAGSSFLSPADLQKHMATRPPKKTFPNTVNRRDRAVDQLSEEEREFRFTIPLDINLKMAEEEFKQQDAAIQETLLRFLSLKSSQDKDGNE